MMSDENLMPLSNHALDFRTFPTINAHIVVSRQNQYVGGGPTTKKTKDILRFCRRHDLFCSFLFFNYKDISLVNTDIYCLTTHLYRNFVMPTFILSVYRALANIVPRIFE